MKFAKAFFIMINCFFITNVTLLAPPKPCPDRIKEYHQALKAAQDRYHAAAKDVLDAAQLTALGQELNRLHQEKKRLANEFADVEWYEREFNAQFIANLFIPTPKEEPVANDAHTADDQADPHATSNSDDAEEQPLEVVTPNPKTNPFNVPALDFSTTMKNLELNPHRPHKSHGE